MVKNNYFEDMRAYNQHAIDSYNYYSKKSKDSSPAATYCLIATVAILGVAGLFEGAKKAYNTIFNESKPVEKVEYSKMNSDITDILHKD